MARRIPEETINAIKDAIDIVDIVGQRVDLKPSGKNHVGLCPFHVEKTPSFNVNSEGGFYKCFGCGRSGSVFHFVMEMDRLEFPEAVRELGRHAGIPVDSDDDGPATGTLAMRDAVAWAARRFSDGLWGPAGARARDYLSERGFTENTLRQFDVGFAPPGWDNLLRAATRDDVPHDLLARLGLVKPRREGGGFYDAFRDRVMFPIADRRGRTIAFGGRVMPDADGDAPKYINSPESELFHKSQSLFGYTVAAEAIRRSRRIVIAEGYTDVMMAHQHGFAELVAVCGTSLTEEHAGLLARLADKVVFLFDGDSAGRAAAERSLDLLVDHDKLSVRVAILERGADPHSFLIEHGPEPFGALLEAAQDLFVFKQHQVRQRHDLGSATGRAQAVDELLPLLGRVGNPVKHDLLVKELAESLDIDEAALRARQASRRRRDRNAERPPDNAGNGMPPEALLLTVLLHRPDLRDALRERYPLGCYRSDLVRRVVARIEPLLAADPELDLKGLLPHVHDPEEVKFLVEVGHREVDKELLDRHLERYLNDESKRLLGERLRAIKQALTEAETAGDSARIDQLMREYNALKKRG